MRGLLRRLAGDESASAAIELAFVAPVIAGMAVVSFGIWQTAGQNQNARAAVDAAAGYYLNGGTSDTDAATVAANAWDAKPADGAIATSRAYKCGTTASTENATCSGGRTPATYVTVTASGTVAQSLGRPTVSISRVVRVR